MKKLIYDATQIESDFEDGVYSWKDGFNKDGSYTKYMKNDDIYDFLEDLYQLKEDLKALIESK